MEKRMVINVLRCLQDEGDCRHAGGWIRIQKGIHNVGDAMCEKLEAIQGEQVGHALQNDLLDKEMDGD